MTILQSESATVPHANDHADVVCLGCGCLCDDIGAMVAENQVVEARNACSLGKSWFQAPVNDLPAATIEGHEVELARALDRAAEILDGARRPIVFGLAGCSIETQLAAISLAEQIGAAIDPGADRDPLLRAFQRVGRASATLGEVKNRADLVVFWGVDPVLTHPRHLERYSADPIGRFLPNGRGDRTIVVVDKERTLTAQKADVFLELPEASQFEALWRLRAIVKGLENAASDADPMLINLAIRLRKAHYSALFFGSGLGRGSGGAATVEALLLLVRDLNATSRSVAMTLGGPANAAGAETVLAWRTGFASAVDFRQGLPRSLPGEGAVETALARGEADAAILLSDSAEAMLSDHAAESLRPIPVIRISPGATDRARASRVAIASARFGLESSGRVLRSDGVMLPVRPPLVSNRPSERALIEAIGSRIQKPARKEMAS